MGQFGLAWSSVVARRKAEGCQYLISYQNTLDNESAQRNRTYISYWRQIESQGQGRSCFGKLLLFVSGVAFVLVSLTSILSYKGVHPERKSGYKGVWRRWLEKIEL